MRRRGARRRAVRGAGAMPRKKPFSVKQKKKQLQDKRERKRGQGGGGAAAQLGRRGVPPHRGRAGGRGERALAAPRGLPRWGLPAAARGCAGAGGGEAPPVPPGLCDDPAGPPGRDLGRAVGRMEPPEKLGRLKKSLSYRLGGLWVSREPVCTGVTGPSPQGSKMGFAPVPTAAAGAGSGGRSRPTPRMGNP